MKKVLLIVIAAAIGIGVVMMMQSNKVLDNGQSSMIAPITDDTMTPATEAPASDNSTMMDNAPAASEAPAMPETNTMDSAPAATQAPASDNSTMMDNAPAATSAPAQTDMQGTMQQNMDNTGNNASEAVQRAEDAAMNGAAANPGAPIDNVTQSTK